ncbi:MAG TPA: alanine--glyoxylate aminotransferase family protein [Candidatus Eisenbacteria bacterium]|nr:alanine--glyoxylate aminotransferase family protein [Candidatus Eisenbacteria bacterium]
MKRVLFTPGPTQVPDEVLASMSRPLIHHRTDEYRSLFLEATRLLSEHLGTTQPLLTLSCSGSGAMEAAAVNLLSPGDEVIVVEGGKFGARWGAICQAYGVTVHLVSVAWGRVATVEEVESALAAHPNAKAVFLTHSETSTGALFPAHEIAAVVRKRGVLTVIDAVTSFGVYDLRFDRSDFDGVVWGSQKGQMIPPGLGYVCYSPRAWSVAEKAKLPRFYFNLVKARGALEKGDTPFTPAISLVLGAHAAATLMAREGREAVFARHQRNADATRRAVHALGLKLFAEVPTNTLTAVHVPAGVDGGKVVKTMESAYGVKIAGGQDQLKGKIFRLGHIGYYDAGDILRLVGAFESALIDHGYAAEYGVGLRAAQESFRRAASGEPARVG